MADFDLTNYISSSVANRTSVSGLASGIDTESVIQSIIDAESAPLQKLTERKESMTNRQKALNELSEELTEFRTFTNNWRLESNFLQYQTTFLYIVGIGDFYFYTLVVMLKGNYTVNRVI